MPKKLLTELKLTRKIAVGSRGDYTISIPKRLATIRKLKPGQTATWKIQQNGTITLTL
jgi:hypothetical protein